MAGAKRKRFLLIYATQTGQAKAIAEEIAETAPNHGLEAEVHCISLTEKKFWLEREKLVVMISSTTGDGDPPDLAGKFWRRLKKKTLPSDHLAHLRFSFLGLGDTNYSNFCNCGKMMNARLLDLGAKHFYAPAWADDAVGLELAVEPWIEGLWAPLKEEVEHLYNSEENNCDSDASVILNGAANIETNDRSPIAYGLDMNDQVDGDKITTGHDSDITEGEKSSTIKLNPDIDCKDLELTKKQNSKSEIDNEITKNVPVETSSSQEQNSNKTGTKLTTTLDPQTNGVQNKEENPVELKEESDTSNEQKNDANVASLTRSIPPLSESALSLPVLPPAFIKMVVHPDQSIDLSAVPLQNGCAWPSAKSGVTMATVLSVKQLTSDDAVKRTLTLTLDVSDCDWKYEPGDSFGIICQNSQEEVQQLISRLKCDEIADQPFSLEIIEGTKKKNPSVPEHIPRNATLRHVLLHCCDIRTAPKKAFLRRLVEHTSDPAEKRRLQELCSRQGSAQYGSYIRDAALSLLDVLTAFPSCFPPAASLIEHLPRLQARPYSASSCLQATPGRLSCVFNVIEIPEGDGRSYGRSGVCTGWIDRLTRGIQRGEKQGKGLTEGMGELTLNEPVKIPIYLRSNQNFRLPEDTTKPIIMIGPGTGVAPFVGFLQKRDCLKTQGAVLAESWLFYGCRHETRDFLFREELERYRETGVLTQLCVCFSREEQDSGQPRYVQHNIKANAEALVKLVDEEEAIVYVCGDAKGMAKGVTRAFVEILCQIRGMDTKEAEAYMMQKRLRKTYLEDVWT